MEYTLWLDSLLGNEVLETLYAVYQTGDPGGEPDPKECLKWEKMNKTGF